MARPVGLALSGVSRRATPIEPESYRTRPRVQRVARPVGLEPTTPGLEASGTNQTRFLVNRLQQRPRDLPTRTTDQRPFHPSTDDEEVVSTALV